jgi:hypothetical protein
MTNLIYAAIAAMFLLLGMSLVATTVVLHRYFQLRRAGYIVTLNGRIKRENSSR